MEGDNLHYKTVHELRDIRDLLHQGSVAKVISKLWSTNDIYSNYKFQEKLTSIDTDFGMMKKYWKQGVEDSQRNAMYNKICQDIDDLLCDMEMERMKCELPFFKDCRRKIATSGVDFTLTEVKARLEAFVSDFTMTDLLPENRKKDKLKELHAKHQGYLDMIFNYILIIGSMSKIDRDGWADIMITPTIDAADRQMLMAALVINMQNVPQKSKMECMLDIFKRAEDDAARHTSIVGWTLGLRHWDIATDNKTKKEIIDILNSPENIVDLMSLQMQIFMAMNAEQDSHTMDTEINKVRMTNEYRKIADSLEGKDVDHSLDDVLNAGENNEQMDEWMETISKLSDMRKKGADLFFSSFAQLKTMGFFSKASNWFVNFYIDHPDIQSSINLHPKMSKFLQVFTALPMLPTDKYSFVMLSAKMVKRLPPEMLESAFNDFPDDAEIPEIKAEELKGMMIRDSFTKLLYRFYKLFGSRECFDSPLERKGVYYYGDVPYVFMANPICKGTFLVRDVLPLCKSMYKMGRKEEILDVMNSSKGILDRVPMKSDGFDFLYFWGAYCYEMSNIENRHGSSNFFPFTFHAQKALESAFNLRPDAVNVKKRLLKMYYELTDYELSKSLAEDLLKDFPDDEELLKVYAVSLMETSIDDDETEKAFYKLVYLYPDNVGAIDEMPKLLIKKKKFEQVEKYVREWIGKGLDKYHSSLYKWMALCCYQGGRLDEAVDWFAKFFTSDSDDFIDKGLHGDEGDDDFLQVNVKEILQKNIGDLSIDPTNLALLVGCIADRIDELKAQKKVEADNEE